MPQYNEEDNESITSQEYNNYNKSEKETYITSEFSPLSPGYCTNAVNKSHYPFKVNSKESLQLFIVMSSLSNNNRVDPIKLYYDNPEQYEINRLKISLIIESFNLLKRMHKIYYIVLFLSQL